MAISFISCSYPYRRCSYISIICFYDLGAVDRDQSFTDTPILHVSLCINTNLFISVYIHFVSVILRPTYVHAGRCLLVWFMACSR